MSSAFRAAAFVEDALAGYDALDLMARGRKIAQALRRHLPHVCFVAQFGLELYEASMRAQYELAPGQAVRLRKSIALAEMTTRRHYAGVHRVDALVNGRTLPLGSFELTG